MSLDDDGSEDVVVFCERMRDVGINDAAGFR